MTSIFKIKKHLNLFNHQRRFHPPVENRRGSRSDSLKLDGKGLVAFGAAKGLCSLYLMSAAMLKAHKQELGAYKTSTGTIHFPLDKPLPTALVRKLVKARIKENKLRAKAK